MYTGKHFTTAKSGVTIIVITLAAWGVLGFNSFALAATNKDIPVKVVFEDEAYEDLSGNPIVPMITSDGVDADGDDVPDYSDEESKVLAVIGRNNGQFWLDTNTSKKSGSGRTLELDFGSPLAGVGGNPDAECPGTDKEWPLKTWPFGSSTSIVPESAEILTATTYSSYYVDLRDMSAGQSLPVALRIQFWFDDPRIGEDLWEISFGDTHPPNGTFPCRQPAETTDPARVTCIVEDAVWEIEALPAGTTGLGAALHSVDYNGQSYWYGNYDMPFKITITTLTFQNSAPPASNTRSGLTTTWGSIK